MGPNWGVRQVVALFWLQIRAQQQPRATAQNPHTTASAPLLFSFWHNRCIGEGNPPRCSVWDALSINGDRLAANGPGTT